MKELVCAISHLVGIQTALTLADTFAEAFKGLPYALPETRMSTFSELKYKTSHYETILLESYNRPFVIMMEDDMQFIFDIDFDALVASAPSDWGVLQLVVSNDIPLIRLWNRYLHNLKATRNNTLLSDVIWSEREGRGEPELWCAGHKMNLLLHI